MTKLPAGTVHDKIPDDIKKMILSSEKIEAQWRDITPLARNEFLCWITDAKLEKTRARRIQVAFDKLSRGERRPCCWPGCIHREKNGH